MIKPIRDSIVNRVDLSGSGGVSSVTGLNTDNTDPDNPIVQISVDGVTITGAGTPASPLVAISGGGIAWNEVTIATQTLAVGNGYVMNNASQVVGTLPASALFGSEIRIVGKGAGGWKIAQNSGQTIHFGNQNTTTGTSGSIASQNVFDCLDLLCITADTDWVAHSSQGNLTVT